MDPLPLIVICVLALGCAGAFAWSYIYGPKGLRAQKLRQQVRELEVQIRMSSGMAVVEQLRAVSHLYLAAGDIWNADKYLEKAVRSAESQLGVGNPELVPLLEEHLKLMKKMRRKKEATKLKARIQSISGS